jgi:hypothetical protein
MFEIAFIFMRFAGGVTHHHLLRLFVRHDLALFGQSPIPEHMRQDP